MGVILLLNHYVACMWFWVGKSGGDDGWVLREGYNDKNYGVQYLECLRWSLCQFTPGSARTIPIAIGERLFVPVVLSLSMVIATIFVGSITATMSSVWTANRYSFTQNFLLKKFLNQMRISRDLGARVTRYVDCIVELRHKTVPIGKVEYLKLLSGPLNVELHTMIFQPHLMVHSFFKRYLDTSRTAMRQLCSTSVQTESYAKNDSLFHHGVHAKNMYIVTRGALAYRFYNTDRAKMTVKLDVHHWFTEHALWIQWEHHGHMKGLSDCESIALNASKFWDVIAKATSSTFVLARERAMDFAQRIRCCASFGPGYVTDIPQAHMAKLMAEARHHLHNNTFGEIHHAEHLEMQLIDFSDSDSEADEEDMVDLSVPEALTSSEPS
jgi:hypothetical protein